MVLNKNCMYLPMVLKGKYCKVRVENHVLVVEKTKYIGIGKFKTIFRLF